MNDHDLDAIKAAVVAHIAAGGTGSVAILLETNVVDLLDYAIEGRDLCVAAASRLSAAATRITELLAEVERLKANQTPDGEWVRRAHEARAPLLGEIERLQRELDEARATIRGFVKPAESHGDVSGVREYTSDPLVAQRGSQTP